MTVHELRPTSGIAATDDDSGGELWDRRERRTGSEESSVVTSRDSQGLWASVWPRVLAVLVVGSVGLPAAVASYWHLQEVAARFNPGSALAYWLPLSVDGLLAAALVVVWSRRTRGERVGFGPWAAFAFGMIVTLLANAASVVPESEWVQPGSVLASVAAWMVALFPPVAFAISLELIAIVLRPARTARTAERAAVRPGVTGSPRWTAPSHRGGQALTATGAAGAATLAPRAEGSGVSALSPQSVQAMRAGDEYAAAPIADGQDDTGPRPVATSTPSRRDDTIARSAGAVVEVPAAGETKQAKAEALFVAAWTRGEDLSLSEVDRMIGGNRTAAKAKRSLRDRGMLPPVEREFLAQRAGVPDGVNVRSGRMVPA